MPPTAQKLNKRKHSDTQPDDDVVAVEPSAKKSKKSDDVAVVIEEDDNSLKRRLRPRKPKTTEAEPIATKTGPAKKPRVAQSRKSKTVEATKTKETASKTKIKIVRSSTSNKTSDQAVESTTSKGNSSSAKEPRVKGESDDVQIIKSQRKVIPIDSTDDIS